jgi:hypothetical protein
MHHVLWSPCIPSWSIHGAPRKPSSCNTYACTFDLGCLQYGLHTCQASIAQAQSTDAHMHLCRGIARVDTKEMASLSVEPSGPEDTIIVALFEVPYTQRAVDAWLEREHEYRFLAVRPESMEGVTSGRLAVRFCSRFRAQSPLCDESAFSLLPCPVCRGASDIRYLSGKQRNAGYTSSETNLSQVHQQCITPP